MTTLPFITAPAAPRTRDVGNSESGILRLPLLGGITVQEAITIDELLADQPNAFVEAAKISEAISKEEGITLVEAFTVIERSLSGNEQEPEAEALRIKHASRIQKVINVFAASTQRTKEAAVTALVRHRLALPEWALADTCAMHRRLLNDIYAVYQDELAAENNDTPPVSDEELGKQPPATGGQRKPTGRRSRTTSSTTSPASTTEAPSAQSCAV